MRFDNTLYDELLQKAKESPRLRQNLDLRTSAADLSQRMLNGLMPGTVLPIHRHPKTTETLVVLRGSLEEIFYEEATEGATAGGGTLRETERILMKANGPVNGLSIPAGRWHSVKILEPTIILECKDGPYAPFAPEDVR